MNIEKVESLYQTVKKYDISTNFYNIKYRFIR